LSILLKADGSRYVKVDTNQHIFDEVAERDYPKIARRYIMDNFRSEPLRLGDSDSVRITRRGADKYTSKLGTEKARLAAELDNLLKIAKFDHSAEDNGRHSLASYGWDYYIAEFSINHHMFQGIINIAKSPEGNMFYDITNIKPSEWKLHHLKDL
jgi:hypothetical protein